MDLIETLARRSAAVEAPGDYRQDGLLYCGSCGTPKQCRITFGAETRVVGCQCACGVRRYDAERQAERDRERRLRIETMRDLGITDRKLRGYTFESAVETPELRKARRYAEHFREMQADNVGLLFWGGVGGGKTFAAGCIANALIAKGTAVMVTSFPRILAARYEDRGEIVSQLSRYPLLILDDLGAERQSGYALETVYMIIDERYKSGKPLIVTTNLHLKELKEPKDIGCARIYDRVLELCVPVGFPGASRRGSAAAEKLRRAKELFADDV